MQLILQTANVTADAKNCSYPNKVTVTNASELQEAVKMDHVCAKYKNNYRSIDNFLKSNVVVMDLDNDHTDDPDEWITAEKLEELLPDISYQQTVARLWRQGQTEGTVSVIHIVTDGTVDERILKALEAKDLTQSALIDAVKAEVGDGK